MASEDCWCVGKPPLHTLHLEIGSRWADLKAALQLLISPLNVFVFLNQAHPVSTIRSVTI